MSDDDDPLALVLPMLRRLEKRQNESNKITEEALKGLEKTVDELRSKVHESNSAFAAEIAYIKGKLEGKGVVVNAGTTVENYAAIDKQVNADKIGELK